MFTHIVIPGFPKCGTTSLYQYLLASRQVCYPRQKEGQYILFSANVEQCLNKLVLNQHKHFTIDASTTYVYKVDQVISKLKGMLENRVKIIMLLRNPADRLYSNYNMHRTQGWIKSFNFDRDYLKYYEQEKHYQNYFEVYQKYKNEFDKSRFKLVVAETLFKNSKKVTNEIVSFIGLNAFNSNLGHHAPFKGRGYPKMNPITKHKLLELHRPMIENLAVDIPDVLQWLD